MMFKLMLSDRVEWLSQNDMKSRLPPILKGLSDLRKGECYDKEELFNMGFNIFNIESLIYNGVLCFGTEHSIFPMVARFYYEEQFPEHSSAYPLRLWLNNSFPLDTIWMGLPFCHLINIRHSASLAIVEAIDQIDKKFPFLGIFPFSSPSEDCMRYLSRATNFLNATTKRFGILGGDHRVAWAVMKSVRTWLPKKTWLRYIHIDAHHDLYGDEIPSSERVAHSNFLLNLLSEKTIDESILIGCRDNRTPVDKAKNFGFNVELMQEYEFKTINVGNASVYTHLSVDLDILDPSVYPNVCSPIGDGWSVNKLLETIKTILITEEINSVSLVEGGGGSDPSQIMKKILAALS